MDIYRIKKRFEYLFQTKDDFDMAIFNHTYLILDYVVENIIPLFSMKVNIGGKQCIIEYPISIYNNSNINNVDNYVILICQHCKLISTIQTLNNCIFTVKHPTIHVYY
jgi:hypothetical protein